MSAERRIVTLDSRHWEKLEVLARAGGLTVDQLLQALVQDADTLPEGAKPRPPLTDEQALEEDRKVLAEMDELAKETSKHWPPGVSAEEAVREQRREL